MHFNTIVAPNVKELSMQEDLSKAQLQREQDIQSSSSVQ